jgi:hypothetical protein
MAFSDSTASSFLADLKVVDDYDVLLFLEKTSAARKNPPISM